MQQLAAAAQIYPILEKIPIAKLIPLQDFVESRGDMAAPERVAPMFWVGLVIIWALCKAIRSYIFPAILGRAEWAKHSSEHQRTMVIYVLQIVLTSVALGLQLACVTAYNFDFTVAQGRYILIAGNVIVLLYATELIHRESMRWQMASHHILTITVMIFATVMLYKT